MGVAVVELSQRLSNFNSIVGGALSGMIATKDSLSSDLGNCKNLYESANNGITSSWKDPQGVSASSKLELIISAVDRLKTSIDSDLGGALSEASKIIEFITTEIIAKINEAKSYTPGCDETVTNKDGSTSVQYNPKDDAKIQACNEIILYKMECAEKMIDALVSAMSGVSIGIVGMSSSGSLGAWKQFDYKYVPPTQNLPKNVVPNVPEPVPSKSVLERTGATVVSTVGVVSEAVIDTGEGIMDGLVATGGFIVSGAVNAWGTLCSWFGADDAASAAWSSADKIEEKVGSFVEKDYTQQLHDSFYNETGVGKWVSANSYMDPDGAVYGGLVEGTSTVGKLAVAVVNPVVGGVMAGVDAGGEKMQAELQSGTEYSAAYGKALVKGGIEGYGYYAGGKMVGNYFNKGGVPTPVQTPSPSNPGLPAPASTPGLPAPANTPATPIAGHIGPAPGLVSKAGITSDMNSIQMGQAINSAAKAHTITAAESNELLSAFGIQ